ncbi:MAG: PQQ-dependent sugar dehydrogenase [Thermomicrobiales bacterium]
MNDNDQPRTRWIVVVTISYLFIAHGGQTVAAQFDPGAFAVKVEEVVTGLYRPLQVVDPGDDSGRLFVVDQAGTVLILRDGEVAETPFLDVSGQISDGSEQGLLGMAFHPEYAENGAFFIDYTDGDGNTRVERWHVSANDPDRADPDSATLIFDVEQPFANHNGGLILFGPDGYLYIGLGDGGSQGDPNGNAQNLGEPLGSILRIDPAVEGNDPAYTVPDDNPFVGQDGAMPEIWAYGVRNPWRFSFDRETGDFFLGDVGGGRQEEIDVLPADEQGGANLGWNVMEGDSCSTEGCDQEEFVLPVFTYATHEFGCSVVGGYVYRGEAAPSLAGVYLFADYCSGLIWGMGRDANDEWVVSDPIETGLRISSFGEDATGELYVTDLEGGVYRITDGS